MEAAIGLATGLVDSVLTLLSNELVGAYVASAELGLNCREIKRDLMFTQGLLHEAQRSGVVDNHGLQGLMQELSTKADEAEDALDELHYFIIQDDLDGTNYAVPDLGDELRGHARHGRLALRHTIGFLEQLRDTCHMLKLLAAMWYPCRDYGSVNLLIYM
ncbi:uncharacterized protein [Triticum aestivum]|uniref:uncharacterized protein isoform X2 n=1 Tax=Triticum aestivum TaxID=4565 RepID=UPI001D033D7F|nr:uncharacterized protein LOC123149814 isoform X2 [Triticum aestivum]